MLDDRFTNDDPTVLNRDTDVLLLKLTAQAGTVLNRRARENSAEKIRRLLFMFITPALNLVKLCIIRSFLKFFFVINLGPSCVDSLAVSLLTRAKLKNCGVTLRLSSKQPDLASVVRSSSRLFHLLSCSVMCCLSERAGGVPLAGT